MTVYVVMANEDNASVDSVHRTMDGAKAAAEALDGPLPASHAREWIMEGASAWLHRRITDAPPDRSGPWSTYFVEPFELKD